LLLSEGNLLGWLLGGKFTWISSLEKRFDQVPDQGLQVRLAQVAALRRQFAQRPSQKETHSDCAHEKMAHGVLKKVPLLQFMTLLDAGGTTDADCTELALRRRTLSVMMRTRGCMMCADNVNNNGSDYGDDDNKLHHCRCKRQGVI
jgi:hypothetical protein